MHLNFTSWLLIRVACVTALVLAVSACNKGSASGGTAAPASSAAGTTAGSYVLVTQARPEAPEKFFPAERWAFGLCAEVAGQKNIPVKAFPRVPPDFVSERATYASDGERVTVRKVMYVLDGKPTPENGCEYRLAKLSNASVTSKGEERSSGTDADGKVELGEPQPAVDEPVRPGRLALYTSPRTVNGVPLKCSADNICIVDPNVALVAEGSRPVQAAFRIDDPRIHGTPLITEPVSLAVGKPLDPSLFSLEKAN